MDLEQLDSASARTYSTGQNTLDSELPTLPRRSEDEIGLSPGKDGRTPSPKVKIKLRLSSHDEEKVDIKVKEGEVAAILVDMKEDIEQEAANTEYENRPSVVGRFKEELGLEDEKSLLDVKRKCVEAPHSANARSNKQLVAAPAEMDDVLHLRGRVAPRSIASPLSPYCQVMANPSWETSEGYHR
jgi:hypothetical protein